MVLSNLYKLIESINPAREKNRSNNNQIENKHT